MAPVVIIQSDPFNALSLPFRFLFHCRMRPSRTEVPSVSQCRRPPDLWSISTDLRMRKKSLARRTYSSQSIILRVTWQPLRHLLHTGFWPRYGKNGSSLIRIRLLKITWLCFFFFWKSFSIFLTSDYTQWVWLEWVRSPQALPGLLLVKRQTGGG